MRSKFSNRFSQSSKEEQILSDSWSPLVNEAYNCLKKPILRANYLLMLNGRPLEENENIRLGNIYDGITEYKLAHLLLYCNFCFPCIFVDCRWKLFG